MTRKEQSYNKASYSNSFLMSIEDREDESKCIAGKWYQWHEKFIHICGKLSVDKSLAGWLMKNECTCCGDKAPEQVLMIQSLQQLRNDD